MKRFLAAAAANAFACLALVVLAFGVPASQAFAADLSLTATSVVPGATAKRESGIACEAITAGQLVYRQAATGKFCKSDSDSATAEVRSVRGVALNGAATNQTLTILTSGPITIGATVTVGSPYFLSNTAGGIIPFADLSTGEYPVLLGFATTTGIITVNLVEAGVAVP